MIRCPRCAVAHAKITKASPKAISEGRVCWVERKDGYHHLYATSHGLELLVPMAWARIILQFCRP